MDSQTDNFLNVNDLLERSQPRGRGPWIGYSIGLFALLVLVSAYAAAQSTAIANLIGILSPLVMLGVIGAMMLWTGIVVQRRREEMKQLESIEELMQLRCWPEAAIMLQQLLSQPTRSPQARAQGLIYLGNVLARYHRFSDAITVHEHLLDHIRFDDGTDYGLRLARAMSMLREDHLVDADRAISELRRLNEERDSAGLALVELYRDVKTGHPEEAINIFESAIDNLRDQLGHRLGDAYALVAKAYDMLNQPAQAHQSYERATLLQPIIELERRYPEVVSLRAKYQAATAPAEVLA